MELTFTKQPILLGETVLDTTLEQPVECEIQLPDYCPNIVKLLRCEAQTAVSSVQVDGGRLNLAAVTVVRVFYLGESGNIRSCEQRLNHSRAVELRAPSGMPVATVDSRVRYLNGRALSERRFEVRGAVEFSLCVVDHREQILPMDTAEKSLQLRREPVTVSEQVCGAMRSTMVRETLELPAGKAAVGYIIRASACCRVSESRVIAGRVVTKGELLLHLLYQPVGEGSVPECMDYALPLSQILDVERAEEGQCCRVVAAVSSLELSPRSDIDGDCRTLALEAGLCFRVELCRERQISLLTDCYSTAWETAVHRRSMTVMSPQRDVRENCLYREQLDLPEEIRAIHDLWCEAEEITTRREEDMLAVCMKLRTCMFAATASEAAAYFDRTGEFVWHLPLEEAGEVQMQPEVTVLSTAYSIAGGEQIEVRAELEITGRLGGSRRLAVVEEVTPDRSRPRQCMPDTALVICYAQAGEEIWEIAKRYNTAPDAILAENGLELPVLQQPQMLLIPITL